MTDAPIAYPSTRKVPDNSTAETRDIPAEVESAWFTVARFVGIPGDEAARQLGVLALANVAWVSANALDAIREAVKGCEDGNRSHGIRCGGTRGDGSHEFCDTHEVAFWAAIAQLLGTESSVR